MTRVTFLKMITSHVVIIVIVLVIFMVTII
jgi:hypothetical protein